MNEVLFIQHCDWEGCSMGFAEFDCPNCGETNVDYGYLWWFQDDFYINKISELETYCEKCEKKLIVFFKDGFKIKTNE